MTNSLTQVFQVQMPSSINSAPLVVVVVVIFFFLSSATYTSVNNAFILENVFQILKSVI